MNPEIFILSTPILIKPYPMKITLAALFALTLTGCATYQPVAPDYSGPVATVSDSGFSESRTTAQIFVLSQINGNRIADSFHASAAASYGQGFALTTRYVERPVPATPMKVVLRGSHATGAPIQALVSQASGTFFSVEGTVDFSPHPGGKYIVKGELKKEGSSIWIEDSSTQKPVTQKVLSK